MQSKMVSICIPTYNRPEYLLEAVKSCLNQTYQNFEIIISDNSNDDKSKNAIEQLNSPKVKFYKNINNKGVSYYNFLNALSLASGEYIKYLMDDDLLKPNCLELMVAEMEQNPTAGVAMAPLDIINENAEVVSQKFYFIHNKRKLYRYKNKSQLVKGKDILFDYLVSEYPCCVPTGVMYRKKCFDEFGVFDKDASFAGDVEICMRFATKYDFYYIDQVLSSWRYNSQSDTANLHIKGIDISIFYYLTKKYIDSDFVNRELADKLCLKRRAFLFSSKRSLLNIFAGISSRSFKMIKETITKMYELEEYKTNLLLVPFTVFTDIKKAVIENVKG